MLAVISLFPFLETKENNHIFIAVERILSRESSQPLDSNYSQLGFGGISEISEIVYKMGPICIFF